MTDEMHEKAIRAAGVVIHHEIAPTSSKRRPSYRAAENAIAAYFESLAEQGSVLVDVREVTEALCSPEADDALYNAAECPGWEDPQSGVYHDARHALATFIEARFAFDSRERPERTVTRGPLVVLDQDAINAARDFAPGTGEER